MLDELGYTHARTHAHALDLALGLPHAHAGKYVILLFHGNSDSLTRLSVTLCVRCVSVRKYVKKRGAAVLKTMRKQKILRLSS